MMCSRWEVDKASEVAVYLFRLLCLCVGNRDTERGLNTHTFKHTDACAHTHTLNTNAQQHSNSCGSFSFPQCMAIEAAALYLKMPSPLSPMLHSPLSPMLHRHSHRGLNTGMGETYSYRNWDISQALALTPDLTLTLSQTQPQPLCQPKT